MKDKALKIIAAVLAVTTVASAAAFFLTKGDDGISVGNPSKDTVAYSYENSDFTKAVSVKGANGEVYLPTDFENIYFTADLNNKVAFYEYANGAFSASALPVKQAKANLSATYETIPVSVNYIEKDGRIFGVGVFTSDMDSSVEVYSYAFVKLTNKPSGYGSGYLLLADFEKENFYKADKTYSEIYNFDLASGKASTYVSNNTRLIDKNGTFRSDWTMLTDDFIANLGGAKYFFSSRYYTSEEKGTRADIMILSNAYKPEIVAEDILGTWFVNDANGMHYLRKTDKGFNNVINQSKAEKVLTEFEGDYFTDYLQDGKWLINKKSLVVTDLMTGATKTLKDIDINGFDAAYVSPDGTSFVFTKKGITNENGAVVQQAVFCSADGEKALADFCEPLLFAESSDFVWLDNSNAMFVRATCADGSSAGSVVYSF